MKRIAPALVLVTLLAAGCGADPSAHGHRETPDQGITALPVPDLPMDRRAGPATSNGQDGEDHEGAATPTFVGSVATIDDDARARMPFSWREGCPVGFDHLRLLTLSHWGFDGRVRTGELVVNRDVAEDVVAVFRALFQAMFPIQRMRLVDVYGGDDDLSMAANNTSGFNCREATGHPGVWSEHSYGRAVDVNPLVNPYVAADGTVLPPVGTAFADRSGDAPGMIHAGDEVVSAFASIGWEWGGGWMSIRDYQHFSASGR